MGQVSGLIWSIVVLYTTYHMFGLLQSTHSRRKRLKELGCMEPPDYPHKDPIFGLDVFFDNIKNLKNRRFLDGFKTRFDLYGETFRAIRMGTTSIYTNDPKNYQAVHALQFSDYGVQPLRRDATLPFLGEGVFTMDGPFWEHSREIIRPTFARSNVTNLPAFEAHFRKFLELIPRDSSTVDLKPLLYRLVSLRCGPFFLALACAHRPQSSLTPPQSSCWENL